MNCYATFYNNPSALEECKENVPNAKYDFQWFLPVTVCLPSLSVLTISWYSNPHDALLNQMFSFVDV